MEWLIENLELLKVGQWPPKPVSYADAGISQRALRPEAYFVKPTIIAAEVEMRLEMVGRDGDLCLLRYHTKMPEDKIARLMNWDIGDVLRRINRAMRYMSGKGRKRISYQEFISHKKGR